MRHRILTAALALCVALLVVTRPSAPPASLLPRAQAGNGDANSPNQVQDSGYAPDRGNFKAFRTRTAAQGADTLTTAGILATAAFQVQGRTSLIVHARSSDSAATASFRLAYVWRNPAATSDTSVTTRTFSWKTATWAVPWQNESNTVADNVIKGYSPVYSVTAGTAQFEAAYYPVTSGDLYFDSERSDTVRILVTTAVSAGTYTFFVGS